MPRIRPRCLRAAPIPALHRMAAPASHRTAHRRSPDVHPILTAVASTDVRDPAPHPAAMDKSIKPGVVTGEALMKLLQYAKDTGFGEQSAPGARLLCLPAENATWPWPM